MSMKYNNKILPTKVERDEVFISPKTAKYLAFLYKM